MKERVRVLVYASLIAAGSMFLSDATPVKAGGGACMVGEDPFCEGDWPYGFTERNGIKTFEAERFTVMTNYPSELIRVDSKTKKFGFWPTDDGIHEAAGQIEGKRCEIAKGPIRLVQRTGKGFSVFRVSNPNCQLRFSYFT